MIKANNISIKYDDKLVLDNFSFAVKKGETVCISGSSGKGKTTLLRIISGLEKNFSGKVEIVQGARLGFVFQDDLLLPWYSAKDNVAVVSTHESAVRWLTEFGLGDALDKKPHQLSGGMKRRVALARACAFEPDILILDEAFKGIDSETKTVIIKHIKECFADKTIIITSHSEDEMELFDARIIEL